MRCEGIWITPPTAGIAFGDPAWPAHATSMWWKSSLGCPECSYAGRPGTMTAYQCEGIQIDRCANHGLWLDRGELGRIAGSRGHDLDELRLRLLGTEPDVEKLVAKREEWRKEVEKKRRAAEEYRTWLDGDQKRKIADAERRQAEEREAVQEHDRARAAIDAVRADPRPSLAFDNDRIAIEQRARKRAAEEQRREREGERSERERHAARENLLAARTEIARSVADIEREIRTLRSQLHSAEARSEGERMRLRMVNERIALDDESR